MTAAVRTTVCFEKPVFILLDKDKEVVNPVTDFVGGQEGHIRTRSMRDYFSNHDVRVKYAISRNATNSEIREYLDRNFVHGYGEGAVVARRWTAGLRFLYPHQWGVIMHTHPSAGLQQDWGPYQIRWFDSAAYE